MSHLPNVFAELLEVGLDFIQTLTNVESQQAAALSIYMDKMQDVLHVYELSIESLAGDMKHASSKDVQKYSAEMSMFSSQADNEKTIGSSNQQSLTQLVSKEGTDMSNYVQQAQNGLDALQTTTSLLQSNYP